MLPAHDIDGVWLDDPQERWWVSDATGMPTTGAPRRSGVETPGHHGRHWAPFVLSAGAYALTITIEAATYGDLHRHIAEVKRVLRGRVLTLHPGNGAEAITADIEVAGALEPVREQHGSGFFCDIDATLEIPAGRWFGADESTVTITAAGIHVLPALLGGSAPMSPMITIIGNGSTTNIRITDVETGAWIGIAGDIPAVPVVIDTNPDVLTATAGAVDYSPLLRLGPRPFYLSPGAVIAITQNPPFQSVTIKARRAFA